MGARKMNEGTMPIVLERKEEVRNLGCAGPDGKAGGELCGLPGGWSMWIPWRLVYVDSLEAGLCGLPGGQSMWTPWRLVYADSLEAGPCGLPGGGSMWTPLEAGLCGLPRPVHVVPLETSLCGLPGGWSM